MSGGAERNIRRETLREVLKILQIAHTDSRESQRRNEISNISNGPDHHMTHYWRGRVQILDVVITQIVKLSRENEYAVDDAPSEQP